LDGGNSRGKILTVGQITSNEFFFDIYASWQSEHEYDETVAHPGRILALGQPRATSFLYMLRGKASTSTTSEITKQVSNLNLNQIS
jgi:hypothetical protein